MILGSILLAVDYKISILIPLQLGKLPVEDLTSKATLEGRLVTFKTSKRVIRLPHGTINMADIPREIPTLPTIRFSYSTMDLCNGHFSDPVSGGVYEQS